MLLLRQTIVLALCSTAFSLPVVGFIICVTGEAARDELCLYGDWQGEEGSENSQLYPRFWAK